eukprot:SM000154S01382  [mRNA]  locus=s154:78099:81710:- [translate_table: standard]
MRRQRRRRRRRRRGMKRKASPGGGGGGGGRTSSPPGSRFAACPACLRSVPIHAINAHLDGCPALNLSGAVAATPPPMPSSSPPADDDRNTSVHLLPPLSAMVIWPACWAFVVTGWYQMLSQAVCALGWTQSSVRRPCRNDGSKEEGACPGSSTELIEESEVGDLHRGKGRGKGQELLTAASTVAAHPAGQLVSAGMHTSSQATVVHADAEAHKEVLQQAIVEQTLEHPMSFPVFQHTTKVVHLIRHGHTGLSSADGVMQTTTTASLAGASGPRQRVFDIPLSSLGHKQVASTSICPLSLCAHRGLLGAWMSHRLLGHPFHPECILLMRNLQILTSPLTRALQTLTEAIGTLKVPIEVKELHAEHVFCPGDVGRSPQILARSYPWLSFENIPEQWWYSPHHAPNDAELGLFGGRESMSCLRQRVGRFRQYLRFRAEGTIIVIGHSTFFMELVGTHRRMAHCEILTVRL